MCQPQVLEGDDQAPPAPVLQHTKSKVGTSSPTGSRKRKVETWPAHKRDESPAGEAEQGGGHQAYLWHDSKFL